MIKVRYLTSCYPWLSMIIAACAAIGPSVIAEPTAPTNMAASSELTATPEAATPAIDIIKSESDKRNYRYLTLPNQLQVLLISDPETEKSAASLDVQIGAHQNPPEREGLAHFLEHMLFLGTEKYPQAGEYQAFIAKHGGMYNAYTAAENTNYFFDIENSQLEPALDRFAQFFIAPLFTAEYIERERNAVHSEYVAKLKDDARKAWDVYRDLMNQDNPGALFSVGNHTTLADHDDRAIRADVMAFYQQYYSSHLMSLVVLGRDSLDQLEAQVRTLFTAIPQREVDLPAQYPPLFASGFLPASVQIQPEKELRQLSFNFPIPNPDHLYRFKPYDYVGNLLGHEGNGSLLALLKKLGWAERLHAAVTMKNRYQAVFRIDVELTSDGVLAQDQIVSLMFYAIAQIRNHGLDEWRYDELKQLADMRFRFLEKEPPAATVSRLAADMKTYAVEDILRAGYIFQDYHEEHIEQALAYLQPDNLLLILSAPGIEPYRVSHYYSTPFSVRQGIADVTDIKPGVRAEFSLPDKNIFIPRRLHVKSTSMLEEKDTVVSTVPQAIVDNRNMRAWFLQDRQFLQPKATINVRIQSPLVAASVEGAASAQLFAELLNDQLTDITYPAALAGLGSAIASSSRGFDIEISGYSARQSLLLDKIVSALDKGNFNEERYTLIKQDLQRRLNNEKKNLPFQVLAKQIPVLQFEPYWSNEALSAALADQTWEQFERFATRVFIDAKIDALFYGNYFRSEALKLSALIEHELLGRQTGRDIPIANMLLLPTEPTKPWLYKEAIDHSDHVVELFIQSPSTSIADTAHMYLIRQILQPLFFNELRTEKQLGYIVATLPAPVRTLEASVFVVQSPVMEEEQLITEIDQFLTRQRKVLKTHFAAHQAALIKKLHEPPRSLKEQSDRYWNALLVDDYTFTRRAELIAAVEAITLESLNAYYKQYFLQKNRRLWLSTAHTEKKGHYRVIKNIEAYKQQLNVIAAP